MAVAEVEVAPDVAASLAVVAVTTVILVVTSVEVTVMVVGPTAEVLKEEEVATELAEVAKELRTDVDVVGGGIEDEEVEGCREELGDVCILLDVLVDGGDVVDVVINVADALLELGELMVDTSEVCVGDCTTDGVSVGVTEAASAVALAMAKFDKRMLDGCLDP